MHSKIKTMRHRKHDLNSNKPICLRLRHTRTFDYTWQKLSINVACRTFQHRLLFQSISFQHFLVSKLKQYAFSSMYYPVLYIKSSSSSGTNIEDKASKVEMKPINDKKEDKKTPVVIQAVSHDEERKKKVEKTEVPSRNIDTIKYVEKKLEDKGVQRMERHPANGIGIGRPPPKSGHGGKYTWEGLMTWQRTSCWRCLQLSMRRTQTISMRRKNRGLRGEKSDVAGFVMGEVEVAKAFEDREGVARVELDPHLKVN
ncbi:Uncharacterized protein TCM_022422 [Theobroma cacao]|uniref:Uncharacterized protein n=1 Tax=Theobroma cacao TaxID=3641 RepID=A0A061ETF3_THECC|nr:Uncharacterized protein TCM_022422 [Theobroma cacao]